MKQPRRGALVAVGLAVTIFAGSTALATTFARAVPSAAPSAAPAAATRYVDQSGRPAAPAASKAATAAPVRYRGDDRRGLGDNGD